MKNCQKTDFLIKTSEQYRKMPVKIQSKIKAIDFKGYFNHARGRVEVLIKKNGVCALLTEVLIKKEALLIKSSGGFNF